MNMTPALASNKLLKRAAVYARVSSDERLSQEFNSLNNQTEAANAFIKSQSHEGWVALPNLYQDGGYSGGNANRPALQKLLSDIAAGKVDTVVVYKIDRLSRSLADLSRMLEVFERHQVAFVSVTQPFNTANASGRLMLNTLTAFASFEREVTKERIIDKISASKRKGMWVGGVPALGYDVVNKKLVINESEADIVRRIFKDMFTLGSTTEIARALNAEGITTKSWTTQKGLRRAGGPIDKKYIHALLRNRIYLGEISLHGSWYPAQHQAIIDSDTWGQVHEILAKDPHVRSGQTQGRSRTDSLLRGLLFDAHGEPMYATYASKNGRKYRYYVSKAEMKFGAAARTHMRLPAEEIEGAAVAQIKTVLSSPESITAVCAHVQHSPVKVDEANIVVAMHSLQAVWEQLYTVERIRIVRLMIERVDLVKDGLKIRWHSLGWRELITEFTANSVGAELVDMETMS